MPPGPTEICEKCTVHRSDLRRGGSVRYCVWLASQAAQFGSPLCFRSRKNANQRAERRTRRTADSTPQWSRTQRNWGRITSQRLDDDFLPSAKPPHAHDIVDAAVLPFSHLRAQAPAISQEELDSFEATFAARRGMVRVALVHRQFPGSCALAFLPPRDLREWVYDPRGLSVAGECYEARTSGGMGEAVFVRTV
ncbi:hypothetical protein FB451DRAFT_1186957 [Mycena latifolia]|nr:hypothetical protein FB451DRAFT_1186957 [Mycena latifolia]